MKKETLLEIILGTIGGLIFAIGMCMCLIPEWHSFYIGIFIGIVGFIILLCIVPVYKKYHPRKERKKLNFGIINAWIIGILGALIMGYGMSRIMVEETTNIDMVVGMSMGIIGLITCVLVYPIYSYLKK